MFYDDLETGRGNELESKFRALYSSSALAVNNFALMKEQLDAFVVFGLDSFKKANFERKFPTGLGGTAPHVDFAIESNDEIIAFESKYLEHLGKTLAYFPTSYNKNKLTYLDSFWFSLMDKYNNKRKYLDVAQLIKHMIGLMKYKQGHPNIKITLVYVYWTPKNEKDFLVYSKHAEELKKFEEELKLQTDIDFRSMKYIDLWDSPSNNPSLLEHYQNMKNRYYISI